MTDINGVWPSWRQISMPSIYVPANIPLKYDVNFICNSYIRKVNLLGNAANESKQRWNADHYTQIKVSVSREIASTFKAACEAANVSMASRLSQFMADYSAITVKNKPPSDTVATRRQRRNTVSSLIRQMEQVRDAEERYRDNIPENLQGSVVYDSADQSVSLMNEAIDLLETIY